MITLILGTPGSGKSQRAEALALKLAGTRRRVYIATMVPIDDAGRERVARHRAAREGKGFETLERPVDMTTLARGADFSDAVCLLECASNLVGNEAHAAANGALTDAELVRAIVESLATLGAAAKELIVVSNEFPKDAPGYDDDTRRYVAILHAVNEALRGLADRVDEYREGVWISNDVD